MNIASAGSTDRGESIAYALHRRWLLPAYEGWWHGRATWPLWDALEVSQWQSLEGIRALQLARLQRLMRHAYETTPHYRAVWDAQGIRPDDLGTLEDLARYPLLGHAEAREHAARLRSSAPSGRVRLKRTGGSTGRPMEFAFDDQSLERRMAAWHRGYGWAGAEPGAKQLYVWGGEPSRQWRAQLKERVYRWIYRRRLTDIYRPGTSDPRRWARALDRSRPDVVVAFVNPLFALALELEREGIKPHAPKSIVVGGEALHPTQRAVIQRVFRAPVFETYGSREFMLIAAECSEHTGLHVTAEHLVVEVVDDEGRPVPPGEEGNVAVTDLFNDAQPFIRYLIGDRAVASDRRCRCGRALPLLERVAGRTLDLVVTPDGRPVAGEFFVTTVGLHPEVRAFQVVQDGQASLVVRVALRSTSEDAVVDSLRRRVEALVGPRMDVRVEEHQVLPEGPAGKRDIVVNRWRRDRYAAARPPSEARPT